MMCKVSVVMGTYNESEHDLRASIESVLNQTFQDFEFIILIDNPKNKLHEKIVKEYVKTDFRVKFCINEKNIGLAMTLNKGIKMALGKYIARTDADDICLPERFEKQVQFLDKNQNIFMVATNKVIINEKDEDLYKAKRLPTQPKKIAKLLEYQSFISHSSVMYRRKEVVEIGCYRPLPTSQDYDLWLRCIENNLNIAILDEYLVKNKIRPDSISNKNLLRQWCIHEYIFKMHKKWKKIGYNKYSQEELNKYLIYNDVYNEKNIQKYSRARNYLTLMKSNISKKQFFKAIIFFFKSIFCHKKMIKLYYNIGIYNLKK